MPTLIRTAADNGQMPTGALASIPWAPAHVVQADALPALVAMNAAFRATSGHDLPITDSYRALDGYWGQVQTFLRRYRVQWIGSGPYGDVRWWRGQRYVRHSSLGSAAVPGSSNHGWGLAIDFGWAYGAREWLHDNAHRFGWSWPTWARQSPSYEPWHHEATNAVLLFTTPPDPTEEDDMFTDADRAALLDVKTNAYQGRRNAEETLRVVREHTAALARIEDNAYRAKRNAEETLRALGELSAGAPLDVELIAAAVNDEADQRARDRLAAPAAART